jgi:hypothetical protein
MDIADGQTQQFDFRYNDADTTMNEIDEFYPYVEMPVVAKNVDRFRGSFDGGEQLTCAHSMIRTS